MGYYDEGFEKPKQQRRDNLGSMFLSSVFGGVVAMATLIGALQLGWLPYAITDIDSNQVMEEEQGGTSFEQIQLSQPLLPPSDIVEVVEQVSETIVGVVNMQQRADFFSREEQNHERGTGSGVIFHKDDQKAYIVTNYHVIEQATQVEISLSSGERVEAELIGVDPLTDLAVVSIPEEYAPRVASFGDSSTLRPGEPVMAIGNPLGLEFSRTVTQGIISASERTISVNTSMGVWDIDVIQTDAAINPGNSGGALINMAGQVIGINSLKISQSGVEGLGFAIPSNDVIPIINALLETGEVERPYLGVTLLNLSEVPSMHWQQTLRLPEHVTEGVVIGSVQTGSPAALAGLQEYDLLVEIDEKELTSAQDLREYLYKEAKLGEQVTVVLYRQGEKLELQIMLESTPSPS